MIHVAIVEDESKAREALKACLAYVAERNQTEIQITEFVSGTAFLGGYQPIYDIVLMDIEMPGMNGMETAKALRKMDAAVILIFVTNLTQYAIMGYEVDALSYSRSFFYPGIVHAFLHSPRSQSLSLSYFRAAVFSCFRGIETASSI